MSSLCLHFLFPICFGHLTIGQRVSCILDVEQIPPLTRCVSPSHFLRLGLILCFTKRPALYRDFL
jgi:hypothetical protein